MSKKISELRKGLLLIKEGIDLVVENLDEAVPSVSEPEAEVEEVTEKPKTTRSRKTKEVVEEAEEVSSEDVEIPEDLSKMSYNELKTLASSLGVKDTKIKKPQLLIAIEEAMLNGAVPEEVEEEVKKPAGRTKKESNVLPFKKKPAEEEETEEEIEEDPVMEQVLAETEGMTDEELATMLADVGVRPAGKRQSLIAKIVKAVEAGKITFEESDEEAGDDEEESVEVTAKRKKAITKMEADVDKQVEDEEIFQEDIEDFLVKFNGVATADELEIDEDDLLDEYVKALALMIDDDGKEHEMEDPYVVNGEDFCCGHVMSYDKKGKVFSCEICGSEYED